jgi:hypothetical protein
MIKTQMTTQDIVKNSDEVKRYKMDWEKIYVTLANAVKTNKYRILRSGNTLFVIKIIDPEFAELATFNAESSFKNYVRNIKEFLKAVEVAGYKRIRANNVNIQMINLMKNAGYNIESTPMEKGWYSVVGTKGGQ